MPCGCTSSPNTPTAAPTATSTATPTVKTTIDPTLEKLEAALKVEYPSVNLTEYSAAATYPYDYLGISYALPNGNTLFGAAENGT